MAGIKVGAVTFWLFLLSFQFCAFGKTSTHPIVLVVSFDGFRSYYFNQSRTPTLDLIQESGVTVPYMQPVFPTKTFPNHQSIATGLYAESHGVVDNTLWEPQQRKKLSGYRGDNGFWNYHPEVLPIWIRNELAGKGRTSGCLMWPGSDHTYGRSNNLLPTYYYKGFDSKYGWNDRVKKVISWMTDPTKPANLVFLYYHQPDENGHAFGPNSAYTLNEVQKADEMTAYLVQKLKETGLYDKVNLILLSDHGMKEVSRKMVINMKELIDSSLVEARHGGTPVLQLKAKAGKGDELYRKLTEHSRSYNFSIFKRSELQGHPWYYANSRRIYDNVLVADVGWSFDDIYGRMSSWDKKWKAKGLTTPLAEREYGVHGYSNERRSMRAFFMARGPAFKRGWKGDKPIQSVDVVPLISNILGLGNGIPNNGSWERVKDMVRQ